MGEGEAFLFFHCNSHAYGDLTTSAKHDKRVDAGHRAESGGRDVN